MKLTKLDNINTESVVLKHKILVQATGLIVGREGVLETEKELYLMLSFLNNLIEEDLVEECNDDSRELSTIMEEDLEPFFFDILASEEYRDMYKDVKRIFLNRCEEVWTSQHSILGVIDTVLTILGNMEEEDKKEVLENVGKVASTLQKDHDEKMEKKADQANSKLEQLVQSYQRQVQNTTQEDNAE